MIMSSDTADKSSDMNTIKGSETLAASCTSPVANCDSDFQKWEQHLLTSLHSVLDDDLHDPVISQRDPRASLTEADFAYIKKTVNMRSYVFFFC